MIFILSIPSLSYSISTCGQFIQFFGFFCIITRHLYYCFFCGLCPHPTSGIRLGFSGNNTNAEGIRLGWQAFRACCPSLFTGNWQSFLHTGRLAGSAPGPSSGISASISSPHFHWPDTASFPMQYHWGIHFLFW